MIACLPVRYSNHYSGRISPQLTLADIQKAFLQIGLKKKDRDAFRFLFNIDGVESHFRFTKIPFGVD